MTCVCFFSFSQQRNIHGPLFWEAESLCYIHIDRILSVSYSGFQIILFDFSGLRCLVQDTCKSVGICVFFYRPKSQQQQQGHKILQLQLRLRHSVHLRDSRFSEMLSRRVRQARRLHPCVLQITNIRHYTLHSDNCSTDSEIKTTTKKSLSLSEISSSQRPAQTARSSFTLS